MSLKGSFSCRHTRHPVLSTPSVPPVVHVGRTASPPLDGRYRVSRCPVGGKYPPATSSTPPLQGSTGHPAQSQPTPGFPNFLLICFALPDEIGDFDQPVALRVGAGGRKNLAINL